jgi:hypothetical protein
LRLKESLLDWNADWNAGWTRVVGIIESILVDRKLAWIASISCENYLVSSIILLEIVRVVLEIISGVKSEISIRVRILVLISTAIEAIEIEDSY